MKRSFLIAHDIQEIRVIIDASLFGKVDSTGTNGKLETGDKSTAIPVVSLVCEQCGHVVFFNALKLGLVKHRKAKSPAPETENHESDQPNGGD